jgi:hypothetical protein
VAGPQMMRTPAAVSRACPASTSRTWIQIITECPAGPAGCPETPGKPGPRKNTTPGPSAGPNSRRWPGPARRGRSGGRAPGRWATARSGCSKRPRAYSSSMLSDTAGQPERAQSRRSAAGVGLVVIKTQLSVSGRCARQQPVGRNRSLPAVDLVAGQPAITETRPPPGPANPSICGAVPGRLDRAGHVAGAVRP